jgi:hypothetical protein
MIEPTQPDPDSLDQIVEYYSDILINAESEYNPNSEPNSTDSDLDYWLDGFQEVTAEEE